MLLHSTDIGNRDRSTPTPAQDLSRYCMAKYTEIVNLGEALDTAKRLPPEYLNCVGCVPMLIWCEKEGGAEAVVCTLVTLPSDAENALTWEWVQLRWDWKFMIPGEIEGAPSAFSRF